MKYLGISNDEKFLFTNKGFYILEESSKFVPYNSNILSELFKISQSDSKHQYNLGNITLSECFSLPRKFLTMVLESLKVPTNDKMNVLIEWDKKFSKNLLISESTELLIIESKINESWEEIGVICEGLWDDIKSGASRAWGGIKSGVSKAWEGLKSGISAVAQKVIIPILKQGVMPFLRWVRRNLNTYGGVIADVILSMFPTVVVMKAIWGLIVVLDIYEILTNDYDPKDTERGQMPFLFLITDILSLIFTAAVGKVAGVTLKTSIKTGVKSPAVKGVLSKLLKNLPRLSKFLGDAEKFIIKIFGKTAGGFIRTVFSGIDTIITKLTQWISKTFKIAGQAFIKTGVEIGTKKGLTKLAVGTLGGVGIAELFKEKTIKEGDRGDKVKQIQKALNMVKNTPVTEGGIPTLKFNGVVDGLYGPSTTQAIKDVQTYYKLPVTGKVDPKLAFVFGIEMDPGTFEKIVGVENMKSLGDRLIKSNKWLESKFGKFKGSINA